MSNTPQIRSERVVGYLTPDEYKEVQKAIKLESRSESNFVLISVMDRARRTTEPAIQEA